MHWRAPTLTAAVIGIWAVSALTIPLPESPGEQPTLSLTSRAAVAPPLGLHANVVHELCHARSLTVRTVLGEPEWTPTAIAGWGTLSAVSPLPAVALASLSPYAQTPSPAASDELVAMATDLSYAQASEAISGALVRTAIWSNLDPIADRRGQLLHPVDGRVEIPFGPERLSHLSTFVRHPGLTYRVAAESDVFAVARGIVRYAGELNGYGGVVVIDHGGAYHTVYAHLGEIEAREGRVVEARERLGRTGGETVGGRHRLYFELRHVGDPVDPSEWFAGQARANR